MAKSPRIISVVGKKNSGKTTLVVALAREFVRQGKVVGTIKHGSHPATLDHEGTDTWRHANEGKASRVMLIGPEERVLFDREAGSADPIALVRQHYGDMDLVIVEGFTDSDLPKFEVFRSEIHEHPRWSEDRPNAGRWVAMLVDEKTVSVPFPTFRLKDTSWLMVLTAMAWDHALVLDDG